jgi:membrane fusion protein, multidrug efflux system
LASSDKSAGKADADGGSPPGEADEESSPSDQQLSPEPGAAPGSRESDWAATSDKPVAKGEADGSDPAEVTARPESADHAHGDKSSEQDDEDAGTGSAFDPLTGSERNELSDAGESDPAGSSAMALEQAREEAGPGAADADAQSRRGSRMPLIELLVAVLLVLASGSAPEKADEDAAADQAEADRESRPANQPISDAHDDPPGAGENDDPPATVGSGNPATSERLVEKRDEDAGAQWAEADEESRPANQPISDAHDDPPGAGENDDPPATVGSGNPATSERLVDKPDENTGTRAGEESRPPDRLIGRTPDAVATASESDSSERGAAPGGSESDRAATFAQWADQADEDARARDEADEERRQRRRHWLLPIGLLVLALLIAGGVYYWWTTRNLESTDDAFTDGRAITIAPQVAGEVVSLDVDDNQFVKQDQALIHIDPRQYKNSRDQAEGVLATARAQYAGQQLAAEIAKKNFPALLEQAKAQLEIAKASFTKAQADYDRQISLQRPATTQQDVDQAATVLWQAEAQVKLAEAQVKQNSPVPQQIGQTEAQVRQLKGQIEQAQAQLNQAELNLSWAIVAAPQDGWVTRRNVEKGNYVIAGQQIMSIVTPAVWVTANFKETQLTYMRPGQPARIRIDAYPSLDVRGHVDSIQHGSGSKFTAFPPENATGNFVKIVQRVPVKIIIDSGIPPNVTIPLGISVVPTVTVR